MDYNTDQRGDLNLIALIYQGALGRIPDASGLAYWANELASGKPPVMVAQAIMSGTEYQSQHGGEPESISIGFFYQNLLGRYPTASDINYWTTNAGGAAYDLVAIAQSEEAQKHNENGLHRFEEAALDGTLTESPFAKFDNSPMGETVIVKEIVYVPKPVPTEPDHVINYQLNGTVDETGTEGYAGTELLFGSGNLNSNIIVADDLTAGREIGLKFHYRTGNDIPAASLDADGHFVVNAPAGAQSGIENEQGANINRSHLSIDVLLNNGTRPFEAGDIEIQIDRDPTAGENMLSLMLGEAGGVYFFGDNGVPVQGLESHHGGEVLQDSINLGFAYLGFPNGAAAGTGDILAGEYEMRVIDHTGLAPNVIFDGIINLA